MSAALQSEIGERIRAEGALSFEEFMRMALYHPIHGYYASRVPGRGAGYRTAPALTPTFGGLVTRALHRMWEAMGCPNRFTIVEVGPGAGDLVAAVSKALPQPMRNVTSWRLVEPFDDVRLQQKERLPADLPVEWVKSLDEGRPITGCVLANEVLDNFPVRAFAVADGRALEVFVDIEDGTLIEKIAEPSPSGGEPRMLIPAGLEDTDRFEVRPGVEDWCRGVSEVLDRGYLLVIDYGDVAPDLWVKRPAGTLLTYRDEVIGLDPLEDPGDLDITAHVDFSALEAAARRAGLNPQPVVTQREFLKTLGIDGVLEEITLSQRKAEVESRHSDHLRLLAERGRVSALTAGGGLGDFLVFVAQKGAPPFPM